MVNKRIAAVLCSIFVVLVLEGSATANKTPDQARSLFEETILLLNRTGGIANFYPPHGQAPLVGAEANLLPPQEVGKALDTVISNLREVIRLDPSISAAHYFLGVAYLKKMDSDKAISEFYTAIDVEPRRELTYVLLCDLLLYAKKYDAALDVASRMATQFPEKQITPAMLAGQAFFLMGDFQESLDYGTKIIKLDSSQVEGHILAWCSYYCLGDGKAAAEQLKILGADPTMSKQIIELKAGLKKRCGEIDAP